MPRPASRRRTVPLLPLKFLGGPAGIADRGEHQVGDRPGRLLGIVRVHRSRLDAEVHQPALAVHGRGDQATAAVPVTSASASACWVFTSCSCICRAAAKAVAYPSGVPDRLLRGAYGQPAAVELIRAHPARGSPLDAHLSSSATTWRPSSRWNQVYAGELGLGQTRPVWRRAVIGRHLIVRRHLIVIGRHRVRRPPRCPVACLAASGRAAAAGRPGLEWPGPGLERPGPRPRRGRARTWTPRRRAGHTAAVPADHSLERSCSGRTGCSAPPEVGVAAAGAEALQVPVLGERRVISRPGRKDVRVAEHHRREPAIPLDRVSTASQFARSESAADRPPGSLGGDGRHGGGLGFGGGRRPSGARRGAERGAPDRSA